MEASHWTMVLLLLVLEGDIHDAIISFRLRKIDLLVQRSRSFREGKGEGERRCRLA